MAFWSHNCGYFYVHMYSPVRIRGAAGNGVSILTNGTLFMRLKGLSGVWDIACDCNIKIELHIEKRHNFHFTTTFTNENRIVENTQIHMCVWSLPKPPRKPPATKHSFRHILLQLYNFKLIFFKSRYCLCKCISDGLIFLYISMFMFILWVHTKWCVRPSTRLSVHTICLPQLFHILKTINNVSSYKCQKRKVSMKAKWNDDDDSLQHLLLLAYGQKSWPSTFSAF